MAAAPQPATAAPSLSEAAVFRKYYTDNDYFVSPEGILKILSAIVCVVSSVVFLSSGACAGAAALLAGAAAAALACGALAALLYAGAVLAVPLLAPQLWLYTDIIVSTVMGLLLLVTAVLSMTICELSTPLHYVHGPLTIVNACMVTASAVITYASVMRLWDEARAPLPPPRAPPLEQEA